MRDRFNFDEFDRLCREVLPDYDEQDTRMAAEDIAREEEERWADYDRVFGPHPGQIGGVAVRLSSPDLLPEPPEAA